MRAASWACTGCHPSTSWTGTIRGATYDHTLTTDIGSGAGVEVPVVVQMTAVAHCSETLGLAVFRSVIEVSGRQDDAGARAVRGLPVPVGAPAGVAATSALPFDLTPSPGTVLDRLTALRPFEG